MAQFTGLADMIDGGGPGQSGGSFSGGPLSGGGGGSNTGLFESIGSLVGMVASGGNPMGAALGSGLGSLLGGGSFQDAFSSGIGSFMTGSTMGKAGVAMNALGAMGGGGASPSQRGQALMSQISSEKGQQRAVMDAISAVGGPQTRAAMGIMQALGIQDAQGNTDPIMGGIMRELLYQQRSPKFENIMSETEMQQYATGERDPSYRGTPTPATPRVSYRAEGGFIEGPGTGKSDSIKAAIYQDGGRVQEARLSDGEFVMTADAVKGAGGGDRDAGAAKMYRMMNQFEQRA